MCCRKVLNLAQYRLSVSVRSRLSLFGWSCVTPSSWKCEHHVNGTILRPLNPQRWWKASPDTGSIWEIPVILLQTRYLYKHMDLLSVTQEVPVGYPVLLIANGLQNGKSIFLTLTILENTWNSSTLLLSRLSNLSQVRALLESLEKLQIWPVIWHQVDKKAVDFSLF